SMSQLDEIGRAEKGLNAFLRFFDWFKQSGEAGLKKRLAAVSAISDAAIATRQYLERLKREEIEPDERSSIEGNLSMLWSTASQAVAQFDDKLSRECQVKAYGWGTGIWKNKHFDIVPRKVEAILADALKIQATYQPIISKDRL